jgi:PDZ domain
MNFLAQFFGNRCRTAALVLAACIVGFAPVAAQAQPMLKTAPDWTRSLVNVEITFKAYDAFQPWNNPTLSVRKHGLVVAPGEVLTTAQYLPTHTLVRLQKGGRGRWYDARVKWWDAQSNLALLTTEEPAFWTGLEAAPLMATVPPGPEFNLVRWREGNLENRKVEFSRFVVSEGTVGFAPQMVLEVGTDIGGRLGWAEIVERDGRVAGLTTYGSSRLCGVMPASFIRRVLEAHRADRFPGLGYFDFTWQPGSNPALVAELGLAGAPRGAVVHSPGSKNGKEGKGLHAGDILLEIGGFEIDSEGDYLDPDYGHLQLENLATRTSFAGDTLPMKILRGGKEQKLDYVIPRAEFTDETVPRELFGAPPTYVVTGGLVFQPLAQPFLRGWGDEWRKNAPFRLQYYQYADPADERKSLVVLSGVLPDAINVGYQEAGMLVVDRVNGRTVATLAELVAALAEPKDGVNRFEFMKGRGLQRMLLDAADLDAATKRVVEHYGIPAASRL